MTRRFEPPPDTPLPTPRMYADGRARVHLACQDCHHASYADLPALVEAGRGDVPLIELPWRCSQCRGGRMHLTVEPGNRHRYGAA